MYGHTNDSKMSSRRLSLQLTWSSGLCHPPKFTFNKVTWVQVVVNKTNHGFVNQEEFGACVLKRVSNYHLPI